MNVANRLHRDDRWMPGADSEAPAPMASFKFSASIRELWYRPSNTSLGVFPGWEVLGLAVIDESILNTL